MQTMMRPVLTCLAIAFMSTITGFAEGILDIDSKRHLFILSGQSNMFLMRPQLSFTPAVEKAFGRDNITVIHSAKRGAPIRMWDKDYPWPEDREIPQGRKRPGKKETTREEFVSKFGERYDMLMTALKHQTHGKSYKTVTFIWMQGESDAGGKLADSYVASFERVIERLKADLGIESMHIVIGRLSDYGATNPEWIKMRELQVKYADDTTNCEWVDTDDLNDVEYEGATRNDLHYTKEGYKILGQRFAEKAIGMIEKG